MSLAAMKISDLNRNINDKLSFDVWREIIYYEFIREKIIKAKKCPNFISIILYGIDPVTKIDYNKIKLIKDENQININYRKRLENIINTKHSIKDFNDPKNIIGFNQYYIQVSSKLVEIFICSSISGKINISLINPERSRF